MQKREAMWSSLEGLGFEHLWLTVGDDTISADGIIVRKELGLTYRAHYRIECDAAWNFRSVRLENIDAPAQRLLLVRDASGRWQDESGRELSALFGCSEVDIFASPFTNTLPIRRLNLAAGTSATIEVGFLSPVDRSVARAAQRYSRIESDSDGSLYRYESLGSGFTTTLPVDQFGLVLEYPDFFRRLW